MILRRLDSLFRLHRAKSGLFSEYQAGEIPFIGNGGLDDNAVVGLVRPREGDIVFRFTGIAVSAFCEATVQEAPFIACGRAGNGLVVLEPIKPMTLEHLAFVAAYINLAVRWRFSWYRQTTVSRLQSIPVPDPAGTQVTYNVADNLPSVSSTKRRSWSPRFADFEIESLFDLKSGDYHSVNELEPGDTPVVSCGELNNGVVGFFKVDPQCLHCGRLTIALNGARPLASRYHPYVFAAKDDVAICFPKERMPVTSQLFIATMLNRERWRYNYYRKCYIEKLRRFEVKLPMTEKGSPDHDVMQHLVSTSAYWPYLETRLQPAEGVLEPDQRALREKANLPPAAGLGLGKGA